MKEKIKAILGLLVLNLFVYPFGVAIAFAFLWLRRKKYLKVVHWERFPHYGEKIILVANHEGMLETVLLPSLFYKGYLINPLKYGPLVVVDKKNFWDKWYWLWLRLFLIPVERGNKRAEAVSFLKIRNALNKKRVVIIFPEGGRTFCGKKFLKSRSEKKRIRVLKGGIGKLVQKTGATVVPVWVENTTKFLPNSPDRNVLYTGLRFPRGETMAVTIGNPLRFSKGEDPEEIVQIVAYSLLELADEKID